MTKVTPGAFPMVRLAVVALVLAGTFAMAADDAGPSTLPQVPDDAKTLAVEASEHFSQQEYDQAAACYQQIIDQHPDSLYAYCNLGVARFQQGQLAEAKVALLKAVALAPKDAFSWSNLGIVDYQLSAYNEAIAALQKAVVLNPKDSRSHNYLGCAYLQKGWKDQAEIELKKAIELESSFQEAYFNLSLLYASSSPPQTEKVRANYEQALRYGAEKDPKLEELISNGAPAESN